MRRFPILLVAVLIPGTALAGKAFDTDDVSARQLLEYLDHSDWRYRHDACEALGDRKVAEAADDLVRLVSEDPSERVRRRCLDALDRLRSGRLVPAAESMALNDPDDGNRRRALAQIEDHGNERSGPVLGAVLQDDRDEDTRRKAAVILGKKNWRTGRAALWAAATGDRSEDVRSAAVEALERAPAAEDRDALVACLDDPESDIQRHAARALVRLGDASVGPILREKALDAKDKGVAEEFNEAAERLGS